MLPEEEFDAKLKCTTAGGTFVGVVNSCVVGTT
jgi:hypothetical protein